MWWQCARKTDAQCVPVKPFTLQPAKHSLRALHLSPHPSGTEAGRTPRVFVSDTLCLSATRSSSGCSSSVSTNHGAAQVHHRGQTGRWPLSEHTQTEWERSSRETCLFVTGEIETVKDKGQKRACEIELRNVQLAGEQEGRGADGSKGRSRGGETRHRTLLLCWRHFHSSAVSHCFGSYAAHITLRDQLLSPTWDFIWLSWLASLTVKEIWWLNYSTRFSKVNQLLYLLKEEREKAKSKKKLLFLETVLSSWTQLISSYRIPDQCFLNFICQSLVFHIVMSTNTF